MPFSSVSLVGFLAASLACYFSAPLRLRWVVLLIASGAFYGAWKPAYIIVLAIPVVVDWAVAKRMARCSGRLRKTWLLVSLTVDLGLLFFLKYANLLAYSLQDLANYFALPVHFYKLDLVLPLGISFFTFQSLGYVLDVYRRDQEPEQSLAKYGLFVSFFPHVTSGPIGRAHDLLPQHDRPHRFEYEDVKNGLLLMLWGVFKKLVIADRLGIYVNQVYDHPFEHYGWDIVIATYFFAYQIYCDFSGYTDIARGCAQLFGYKLMENFRRPYAAGSIREFWQRWHISLTTWLRDYLFFGLGVSRTSRLRNYWNVMVVFLVCGLWHGANWTFVLWGGIHGLLSVASIATVELRKKVANIIGLAQWPRFHRVIRVAITFHLVLIAWIFFRANSFQDLAVLARNLFRFKASHVLFNGGLDLPQIVLVVVCIALLEIAQGLQSRIPIREWISARPIWLRWAIYQAAVFAVLLLSADSQAVRFIYFQF
jgi:D-alanyl-lipoteichoic acid acyltransferase DltB (MBOAT superfamily)